MLSNVSLVRLSVIFSIVSWLSLFIIDLKIVITSLESVSSGIPQMLPILLLNLFLLSTFLFYRSRINNFEEINFLSLLWKVLITGLVAILVSLLLRFFAFPFFKNSINPLVLHNTYYHFNIALMVAFLISVFSVLKKLILYQKSKRLLLGWQFFEYFVLGSILLNFLHLEYNSTPFLALVFVLLSIGVVVSVNLKWVAYLNFRQKLKSIFMLLLILASLGYFLFLIVDFNEKYLLVVNLLDNIFILTLLGFAVIYCFFSFLVILFNLPTSSVFEQKLEEVIGFQKMSQTIHAGRDEKEVFDVLLESVVSTVFADAAWLEVSTKDNEQKLLTYQIEYSQIGEVMQGLVRSKIKDYIDEGLLKNIDSNKLIATLPGNSTFKSILIMPLEVQKKQIGMLVMLKAVVGGFDKEMFDIVHTFVNQACISIENLRLLNEALVNERYKEELKIAKKVQRSLLPEYLPYHSDFEISAFSVAADEVGGDFYDVYEISKNKLALIIGDVSGKGTSAAFNMSQMKGVFQSLVQLGLNPKELLVKANEALSRCLEKTSFITASFYIIDTEHKRIDFARAGHCPTLFYKNKEKKTFFYENKGVGLGIVRNNKFHEYIDENEISFEAGDIMVLYSDGITEAKNSLHEEFGFERLLQVIQQNTSKTSLEIKETLLEELYAFCGKRNLDDDYSAVIVKFK